MISIMPQALNDHKKKSFLWLKCSIAKIKNVFSDCMLGLYAQQISLNGSIGLTLDLNYITLLAISVTLITFRTCILFEFCLMLLSKGFNCLPL